MKTIVNELLKPVKFIAHLVYTPIAIATGKDDFYEAYYEEAEIEIL